MKKLLTLAFGAVIALSAMAIPAKPVTQTILLENGQQIQATLRGDECFHFWLGTDGVRYQEHDGIYTPISQERAEQAASRADMRKQQMRRTSARRVVAQADGTADINLAPRGLLILANFSDVSFQSGNNAAQMDSMLNGQNYTYGQSIGSARQYFYEQSGGRYNPHFDVVGPITLPKTMAYYGRNNSDGDDEKCGDMVLHACSIAAQLNGVNMANYDNDNDGYIDFVYIVYAGYNEAENSNSMPNTVWPASWNIQSAIYMGNTSLSTSDWNNTSKYTYGGKVLSSFAYSSERNSSGSRAGICTFCHEFSHVIGLPDYYDTEYGTNYEQNRTPNDWSLMDGGSYNVNGYVPPAYSIFDKYFVGWAKPTVLNSPCDVELPADNFTGYYINQTGTTASATSTSTTYYIENRQKNRWDKGLPGHGMLVWQVKYNSSAWEDNTLNNTARSPRLTVISASNATTGIGSDADPFPGTGRRTSYTPFTSYPLTEITEEDGVISFKFMGGQQCDGYEPEFAGTLCTHTSKVQCIPVGEAWQDTILANASCKIRSVVVSMGGTALSGVVTLAADSSEAYILIPAVTGDISVTALAEAYHGEGGNCINYSWTANQKIQDGTQVLGDYVWEISSTGGSFRGTDNNRGAQFGSGNSPVTTLSLFTYETQGCDFKNIKIEACSGSGGNATMEVYIDDEFINSKKLTETSTVHTFYNTLHRQGILEIRFTNTAKAFYLKSINLTQYSDDIVADEACVTGEILSIYSITGNLMGNNPDILPHGMYIVRRTTGIEKIIK